MGRKRIVPPGFDSHEQYVKSLLEKAPVHTVDELASLFCVKPITIRQVLIRNGSKAKRSTMGRPKTNKPLATCRNHGTRRGRKPHAPVTLNEQRVVSMLNQGVKATEIARTLGISRAAVYWLKKSYNNKRGEQK